MQIAIKFSDENQGIDVQPFVTSRNDAKMTEEDKKSLGEAVNALGEIDKIGYRVLGKAPLVSIEKRDGYLYVEIDENEVISVEKRG